jgi:hypothetical protein
MWFDVKGFDYIKRNEINLIGKWAPVAVFLGAHCHALTACAQNDK